MQFVKEIEALAKEHHREEPTSSIEAFKRYLTFWWCQKFNRCFKDPLLAEYSTEELFYEWLRHRYMVEDPFVAEEAAKRAAEDVAWAMKQARELGQQTAKLKKAKKEQKPQDTNKLSDQPNISIKFTPPK